MSGHIRLYSERYHDKSNTTTKNGGSRFFASAVFLFLLFGAGVHNPDVAYVRAAICGALCLMWQKLHPAHIETLTIGWIYPPVQGLAPA
ncbi:MAG: hypothetical protein PUG87_02945 [Eubacteriales bacterium]|nr:hypothetical protein [Eubacteriales bacterium]